jgi:hypothetical protein
MKTKPILAIILFLAGVVLLWSQMPVSASPAQQVAFPSPTPGPDGRIIYIVKAGETCTEISLLYGVSVEFIRTTNLLDQNCTLRAGQALMIGIGASSGGPVTPGPSAVPTAVLPTATPSAGGTAQVCVLVYVDLNGDAQREANEGAIGGAAISLTSDDGTYSQTQTSVIPSDTTVYQGMCFTNVPPGKYSVSVAAPDGYNPTMNLTSSMLVSPGDQVFVNFGAQPKAVASASPISKGPSPLLGIIGAALLLGGIGMGAYTWRMLRKK